MPVNAVVKFENKYGSGEDEALSLVLGMEFDSKEVILTNEHP